MNIPTNPTPGQQFRYNSYREGVGYPTSFGQILTYDSKAYLNMNQDGAFFTWEGSDGADFLLWEWVEPA